MVLNTSEPLHPFISWLAVEKENVYTCHLWGVIFPMYFIDVRVLNMNTFEKQWFRQCCPFTTLRFFSTTLVTIVTLLDLYYYRLHQSLQPHSFVDRK